jgi:hypothetical protein
LCRHIHLVITNRADIIADKSQYWQCKIAKYRLNELNANWPTLLINTEVDGWCAPLHTHLNHVRADVSDMVKAGTMHVRVEEAVQFMDAVPIFIAGLLNWGYSLDNPVGTAEGDALKAGLINELQRLAASRRKMHTDEPNEHLLEVGKNAIKPVVVMKKEEMLENPIYPPGYEAYRGLFCEWTASVLFESESKKGHDAAYEAEKEGPNERVAGGCQEVYFNR